MSEIAIIGAGFIGLASAAALMRDGHRITLFDPAGVGQGASFGNAGTFAHYACIPVNNPSVFHDLPRFLLSRDSPFRVRWGYLPHLAPWLVRFMMSSLPRRYEASAGALAALLDCAHDGYAPLLADADGLSVTYTPDPDFAGTSCGHLCQKRELVEMIEANLKAKNEVVGKRYTRMQAV